MNKFKGKKLAIIISWVAVLLWMLLIFNLSSQVREESNNLSKGITQIIVETVDELILRVLRGQVSIIDKTGLRFDKVP